MRESTHSDHRPRWHLVLLALLVVTMLLVSLAGCSVAGHHIRAGYAAACGYHVWRLHHDIHTHHHLFAAFQAWRSVHNCARVLGH